MTFFGKFTNFAKKIGGYGMKILDQGSAIAHKVSHVVHQGLDVVDKLANSGIGKEVLDWIPIGGEIRQGINLTHNVLDFGDKALGVVDYGRGLIEDGKGKGLSHNLENIKKFRDHDKTRDVYKEARAGVVSVKNRQSSLQKKRKK
jgi:hypothetical protein